ncbi:MAG: glycosyltransferase family 2 protein [Lachnospiraceae bacterium]|nr:glycosyltransferase family 2 protein [Lachnospiraceae bacterium]MDD7378635.1 glycosyltransferase family 2 protein [Lachnospiraceae bacterium]MDY4617696.1 glycosyltransferase family 2 protein [Lachnospiraceae bacterium]
MDISVVIPMYGCKAAIRELHQRLVKTLEQITEDFEIIMVNDACPQNSWEVIEEICKEDRRVKGIEMARNFGQIKAITAGLDYSTGDWVVVMDCDLQDRPEEILNLYNKAQEGYDVVFARRANRKDSPLKVFVSKIFYKIYSFASDGNYDPAICNFSISRRVVIDNYCKMRELHRAFVIYVKWQGFRQTAIDVEHNERYEGKSSYNMKKRMKMAGEILTSQSDKLLRFTVSFGFLMTLASFIAIIVLIIRYFCGNVATGWTSIIATNCLIGGIIIMVVGLVGIYVGNIFMQTKQRPLYVVRQILNDEKEEEQE